MTINFISISDTHFGLNTFGVEDVVTGLNTRTLDGYQAFDKTIDYAIENNIKLIVHSGDVFNTKNIGQNNINAFYERVARLSASGVFFYVLHGNHDSPSNLARKNGLDVANTIDIPYTYFTRGNDYLDLEYIQIVSLSYWNTIDSITQYLDEVSKEVDWERPVILVGHLEVNYPGSIGAFKDSLTIIPLEVLTKHSWSAVQLGHIHKPQVLNESPKVFYTGSLVRCTFTEESDPKGFWVNTIDKKKFTMRQIPFDCLKMLTITGTMEDLKSQLEKVKPSKFKNTMVRLVIEKTDEAIDEKFFKDKFTESFKFFIKKQPNKIEHKKIDTQNLLSLHQYTERYFDNHPKQKKLLEMADEIKSIDEAKLAI